jgi:nitrite reductase (NADH) small subunit
VDKGNLSTGRNSKDNDYGMKQNPVQSETLNGPQVKVWYKAASVTDFPKDGGACLQYKGKQVAIFNFSRRNEWYACQNLCPHKMQMILSRGMIGSTNGEPKVACPFHKRTFSLQTGKCLNAEECSISVFPVKVVDGYVHIGFEE